MHIVDRAEIVYVNPRVELDDRDVQGANVVPDNLDRPAVQVNLNPSGVRKLSSLFSAHQGGMVAILAEGKVLSAPVIMSKLVDDLLDITGNFTSEQAVKLAAGIKRP